MASKFYEKGFEPNTEIKGMESDGPQGSGKPGYIIGNESPKFKKYQYEAEGEGSKGPAAK